MNIQPNILIRRHIEIYVDGLLGPVINGQLETAQQLNNCQLDLDQGESLSNTHPRTITEGKETARMALVYLFLGHAVGIKSLWFGINPRIMMNSKDWN